MLNIQDLNDAVHAKSPLEISDSDYTQSDIQSELSFIGDLHGAMLWYQKICRNSRYTLQLGDLNNSPSISLYHIDLDPFTHKYLHGNHDWLPGLNTAHYLGLYGICMLEEWNIKVGFISGAFSIDKGRRSVNYDKVLDPIHDNEELSYKELDAAVLLMKSEQPDIIISHTAPMAIYDKLEMCSGKPIIQNRTSQALDSILSECSPSLWAFGHFHQNRHFVYQNRVGFACIDMQNILPFVK